MKSSKVIFLTAVVVVIAFFFSFKVSAQTLKGTFVVRGQSGPSQLFPQVKAVRCDRTAGKCDLVQYQKLNEEHQLPVGSYIVGFENSIYPGWVQIQAGSKTTLDLVKLQMPSQVTNQAKVRVFRDFDAEIEKNKVFFTQLYMGRPLFRLSQYSFGDLYLSSPGMIDITLRMNYDACNKIRFTDPEFDDAKEICAAATKANNSRNWRDMSSPLLFKFSGRDLAVRDHMAREIQKGQYIQNLVTESGDRRQVVMRRQLVSAPLKGSDFVSVFPGQYRIISDAPRSSSISVTVGPQTQKFD